jgi:hypothetical protein
MVRIRRVWGQERNFLSLPPHPDWPWGPANLLSNGYRAKWPACEADYSPPSSDEVKNEWSYTSTLRVFMVLIN